MGVLLSLIMMVSLLTPVLAEEREVQLPSEETIQEQVSSEEAIQEQLLSEETAQEQLPSEETVQEQLPSEEAVQEQVSSEETVQEQVPSEETIQEQVSSEEAIQEQVSSEETIQEQVSSEEVIQEQVSSEETIQAQISRTAAWELNTVTNPVCGSIGGEWTVIGLARSKKITDSFKSSYLANLRMKLDSCQGELDSVKYTEYARVTLAVTSLGMDAGDIFGYSMLEKLADYDKVSW